MDSEDQCEVTLVSKENTEFKVTRDVALMSQLIRSTLGADDEDEAAMETTAPIPLPNVTTPILAKVLDFCKHFQEEPMTEIQTPLKSSRLEELVQEWYVEFVKVDRDVLFDMVAAANFMDIKALLDLTCLAVSILIRGKSASELRSMFNVSETLTPDEEAQIARENNWANGAAANNNDDEPVLDANGEAPEP